MDAVSLRHERAAKKAAKLHVWVEAEEHSTKAIVSSLSPHYDQFDIRLTAREKQGKYEEALQDAERMIRLEPRKVKGYLRSAKLLQLLSRNDEALNKYDVALKATDFKDINYKTIKRAREVLLERYISRRPPRDLFKKLPPELVSRIFEYIDFRSTIIATRVCRSWKRRINADPTLYKNIHVPSPAEYMNGRIRLKNGQAEDDKVSQHLSRCLRRYIHNAESSLESLGRISSRSFNGWRELLANSHRSLKYVQIDQSSTSTPKLSAFDCLTNVELRHTSLASIATVLCSAPSLRQLDCVADIESDLVMEVPSDLPLRHLSLYQVIPTGPSYNDLELLTKCLSNCRLLESLELYETPILNGLNSTSLTTLRYATHSAINIGVPKLPCSTLKHVEFSIDYSGTHHQFAALARAGCLDEIESVCLKGKHDFYSREGNRRAWDMSGTPEWYQCVRPMFTAARHLRALYCHAGSMEYNVFRTMVEDIRNIDTLDVSGQYLFNDSWISLICDRLPSLTHLTFNGCSEPTGIGIVSLVQKRNGRRNAGFSAIKSICFDRVYDIKLETVDWIRSMGVDLNQHGEWPTAPPGARRLEIV